MNGYRHADETEENYCKRQVADVREAYKDLIHEIETHRPIKERVQDMIGTLQGVAERLNRDLHSPEFRTLEQLTDGVGLSGVLQTVAEVCWSKSEHIGRARVKIDDTTPLYKQYEKLQKRWDRMAETLEKLAERASHLPEG